MKTCLVVWSLMSILSIRSIKQYSWQRQLIERNAWTFQIFNLSVVYNLSSYFHYISLLYILSSGRFSATPCILVTLLIVYLYLYSVCFFVRICIILNHCGSFYGSVLVSHTKGRGSRSGRYKHFCLKKPAVTRWFSEPISKRMSLFFGTLVS